MGEKLQEDLYRESKNPGSGEQFCVGKLEKMGTIIFFFLRKSWIVFHNFSNVRDYRGEVD